MEEYDIRPLLLPDEFRACQEVQRRAWGVKEEGYLVPVATMAGAAHHGGLVLGAFAATGEIVAFSFAFLGKSNGNACLYSQLTGVLPEHQGSGLGRMLKIRQREFARSAGLEEVVWAFDPFKAGNAKFNLEILGAVASEYIVDMYGPRSDELNANLSQTDRLIAHWSTNPAADRPEPGVRDWSLVPLFAPELLSSAGEPASCFLLEIPLQAESRSDADQVEKKRFEFRSAFVALFELGFTAVGFSVGRNAFPAGSFYLLERLP